MTEMHDVVKLLLARIESHPEEFERGMHRWDWVMERVKSHGSKEENEALHAALRPIRLQETHEDMLDELLNGDERRRKEQEEHEYERTMMQQHQLKMQHQQLQSLGLANAQLYQQQHYGVAAGTFYEATQSLYLDDEKLDGSILKKLKKAVGL
jgi:hypothetical protein